MHVYEYEYVSSKNQAHRSMCIRNMSNEINFLELMKLFREQTICTPARAYFFTLFVGMHACWSGLWIELDVKKK